MEYRLGWNTISEVSRPLCQVIDCPRAPPTSLFHCIPAGTVFHTGRPGCLTPHCIVLLSVVLHSHCIVLLDLVVLHPIVLYCCLTGCLTLPLYCIVGPTLVRRSLYYRPTDCTTIRPMVFTSLYFSFTRAQGSSAHNKAF